MRKSIKITVLVDDRAKPGLVAEHGLSLWIETPEKRILFDTGQGATLPANAAALGIDLASADAVVISHGHYDHTGGILHVLRSASDVKVYYHLEAKRVRYSMKQGTAKAIHMNTQTILAIRDLLEQQKIWVHKPVWITPEVGLTGTIPRRTPFEDTGGPFFLDECGVHADPLSDDIALWIHTPVGLIICTGCCHAGLVNTINYIRKINQDAPVHAIIGGFHLLNASPERLQQTIAALQPLVPAQIIPLHCTGESAKKALQEQFPRQHLAAAAGTRIRFSTAAR